METGRATVVTARRVRPKSVQLPKKAPDQQEQELSQEQQVQQETWSLGITLNYVKDWNTPAAFRELYQNWYVPFPKVTTIVALVLKLEYTY